MWQVATKMKTQKSSKHPFLDYFLSLHTLFSLLGLSCSMCVRRRSWTDLLKTHTLHKLQLCSPLVADSQVSSKWLPLLAVSPLSPTCWTSLPTSHFSLVTLPALSTLLIPPLTQPFCWQQQCVFLGDVLGNAAHFPASRKAADPQNCVWAETTQSQMSGW